MEMLIIYFFSALLLFVFMICSWHVFMRKKINFKDYKLYVALIGGALCCTSITLFLPQSLKFLSNVILMSLVIYIFFCKDISKALLMSSVSEFVLVIVEFVVTLFIFLFINNNLSNMMENWYSNLMVNLIISVLALLALKTSFPLKIYDYLVKTFNNLKQSNLVIYFVVTIALISLFLIMTYMNLSSTVLLTCNTVLTILYVVVIVKLANTQGNFRVVSDKYKTSLTSLQEYEDMMDRTKVANHENKNQLLTIRNMVKANDKGIVKYIENLVDSKIKDNENIFYKTSKIPEGGLRAAIYSKLCKMEEENIEYTLNIANDVRAVDLIEMGDGIMLDVCNVISVFLDNAIEEVKKLDDKHISVELFVMDGKLCIEISNNYEGTIDLEKIDNAKYSTKGDGHGYGLTLVKQILKRNKLLENERRINGNIFSQVLKIKMQEKTVD